MKKKIPLILLQYLQPFADAHKKLINIVQSTDNLFKLTDKDKNSDFYFTVLRQELSSGNPGYIIEFKPTSSNDLNVNKQWTKVESITAFAKNWIEIITAYDSIQTIYDDPIERQYQEEFYNDFKIVDDDAQTNGFNFTQQIILLNYVERIQNYLSNEEKDISEDDREILLEEISILQQSVSVETKDSFIKKLSSFWAKLRKKSIKGCQFALKEFSKEVIKEVAKKGIDINWAALPQYIEQVKAILKIDG